MKSFFYIKLSIKNMECVLPFPKFETSVYKTVVVKPLLSITVKLQLDNHYKMFKDFENYHRHGIKTIHHDDPVHSQR